MVRLRFASHFNQQFLARYLGVMFLLSNYIRTFKLKPYKSIQSKNFSFLLFIARAIAILGYIFLAFSIVFVAWQFFRSNSLMAMSMLGLVFAAIGVIITAGILAALISIEENTRVKAKHTINNNET